MVFHFVSVLFINEDEWMNEWMKYAKVETNTLILSPSNVWLMFEGDLFVLLNCNQLQ